ncbi:MAG: NAD-dependent epimerase [Pseudomonadota bacterium]
MKVLVTGAAGFIGFHTACRLLKRGDDVVGLDNLDPYYDVSLKTARLDAARAVADTPGTGTFTFVQAGLEDEAAMAALFEAHRFDRVIHLGAQAGVRHSLSAPRDYVRSNVMGFTNVLEGCRAQQVAHLTYASTSSVYGANRAMPFAEDQGVDHPLQFYAATKRANELMAHSYSHLYGLPTTGLRFFTVYGPWGRPDMALFIFTAKILAGEPIPVFNHGAHSRAFTYVDDIVEGVVRVSDRPAASDPGFDPLSPRPDVSAAPFRIYNIGNSEPVPLSAYIEALEAALGRRAERQSLPMQPGDVPDTSADTSALAAATGYAPTTPIAEGVARFVNWYRKYYGKN